MATIRWQGNVSNAWAAAGNWIGGLPAHGDDVQFLGADLGANRCGVGPTAVVLLNSILADAAYDVGVNATVCYANCGMDGRPLATVTIDGDSYMADGWATLVTLNGDAARINGGTGDTVILNGTTLNCRVTSGTWGTVNCVGANSRIFGAAVPFTITTVNMNGASGLIGGAAPANFPTVTTLNMNGATTDLYRGVITTVNMNADDAICRLDNVASQATTVYVYGAACEMSLTLAIALGNITNGPHMCGLDQILYDYDTGLVIGDLTQIPSYSAGAW